jgi:hypothetical protein
MDDLHKHIGKRAEGDWRRAEKEVKNEYKPTKPNY